MDLEFEKIVGANTLALYLTQVNELVKNGLIQIKNNKLKVTESGKAWIIDINKAFFTENNINYSQPQYEILDMFEGNRERYTEGVIDEKRKCKIFTR